MLAIGSSAHTPALGDGLRASWRQTGPARAPQEEEPARRRSLVEPSRRGGGGGMWVRRKYVGEAEVCG